MCALLLLDQVCQKGGSPIDELILEFKVDFALELGGIHDGLSTDFRYLFKRFREMDVDVVLVNLHEVNDHEDADDGVDREQSQND